MEKTTYIHGLYLVCSIIFSTLSENNSTLINEVHLEIMTHRDDTQYLSSPVHLFYI